MVREHTLDARQGVGRRRICVEGFVAHDRQAVVVILRVKLQGNADLAQIAHASSGAPGFFGFAEHRQQQTGQYADDREHRKQFNQCKGAHKPYDKKFMAALLRPPRDLRDWHFRLLLLRQISACKLPSTTYKQRSTTRHGKAENKCDKRGAIASLLCRADSIPADEKTNYRSAAA